MRNGRSALGIAIVVCLAAFAFAGDPIQVSPDAIVWKEGPPSLPPGARSVVLEGDPKGEGVFTMRVWFPPDYRIPVHTHAREERVTVISGTVFVGIGDAGDRAKETRLGEGSFYVTPSPLRHWVRTDEEGAVLQVTGIGPWTVEYLHPEDDPRNAAKETKP